jgi:HEAT repeat protein
MANHDAPDTIALLDGLIRDGTLRHTLRRTAVATLAKLASGEARDALVAIASGGVDDARVRLRVVEAVRELERDDVTAILARLAETDPSMQVRAEAVDALGARKAAAHAGLIAELASVPSHAERLRTSALRALAALDDERGLDLAIRYAAYGNLDRARPAAIDAVGKLAAHDKERASDLLLALLEDPERRARSAAAGALAEMGDERAIPALEAAIASAPSPWAKRRAERRLQELRDKLAGKAPDQPAGEDAGPPPGGGRRRGSR